MKRIMERMLSLILVLILVASSFPPEASASAEEKPTAKENVYQVTIEPVKNGTVKTERETETYLPGETVRLPIEPKEGYQVAELKVKDPEEKELKLKKEETEISFEMPAGDVRVSAKMEKSPVTSPETSPSETEKETEQKQSETVEETEQKQSETAKKTEQKQSETATKTEQKQSETAKETEQRQSETAKETEDQKTETIKVPERKKAAVKAAVQEAESKAATRTTSFNFPNIQKNGQSIFKCPSVTKITSGLTIPSAYSFYMRGRANSGVIGFKDGQAANPQPDENTPGEVPDETGSRYAALREKYKDGGSEAGKIYCTYENAGIYNGQWIDVKLTIMDWETKHSDQNPWGYAVLRFNTSRPGIYSIWAKWVEVKYEFFAHGTSTPVQVKGYSTWLDVDAGQGVMLKGAFESFYATKACELKYNTVSGNPYFYSPDEENIGTDKEGTRKFTALFSGKQATVIYSFQKPSDDATDDNASPGKTCAGGISNRSSKDVPGPSPTIYKRVSDNDEKMVVENTLNQSPEPRKEGFTYTITSEVFPEDVNTFYSVYQIRDEMDKGLTVNTTGITITNEEGANAKSSFNVAVDATNTLTITAKPARLQKTEFYGHTYTVTIPVSIKDTIALNKAPYWESAASRAKISNKATLTTPFGDLDSNWVNTYVPLYGSVEEGLKVVKTEDGTGIPLSGVTFQVYEWNGSAYSTTPYDTLEQSRVVGTYRNTKPYLITNTNQGKFKVVETRSAVDHFNSGWSQEIQYDGTAAKELTYSVTNKKMEPKIAVTKLADRTTVKDGQKTPGWYKYEDTITYAIVAKNTGNVPVKNMVVTDTLSEELKKAVQVESAGFEVNATATTTKGKIVTITKNSATQVTLDALEAGDSVLLTFQVKAGSREQVKSLATLLNLNNVVKVTAVYDNSHQDAAVPEDADDTDNDKINVYNPLISVTKMADRTELETNEQKEIERVSGWYDFENTITYTMVVRNYGNVPVKNLIVADTLSENLAATVNAEQAAFLIPEEAVTTEKGNPIQITQNPENGTIVTLDTLAAGDSVKLTFTAQVRPRADLKDFKLELLEDLTNYVKITGTFDTYEAEPEPVPEDADDSDQDDINIYNPLISITKLADKTIVKTEEQPETQPEKTSGWYHFGNTITYTMVVKNYGNVTVNDLVVEDTLSKELGDVVFADEAGFILQTSAEEEPEMPESPETPESPGGTEPVRKTRKAESTETTPESESTAESESEPETGTEEKPEEPWITTTEKGKPVQITKNPENGKIVTLDTLETGDSVTLTFTAKVRPREDLKDFDLTKLEKLNNHVKVTGTYDNGDPDPKPVPEDEDDQNDEEVNVYNPLLSVTKLSDQTTVTGEGTKVPGEYDFEETITYSIQVRNYGNADAFDLLLEDTLSEELQKTIDVASASFQEGSLTTEKGQQVKAVKESNTKLKLDALAAGDSVTVTFQAKVKSREDLKDYTSVQLEKLNNHVKLTGKYDEDTDIPTDEDDDDDETIGIRNPKLSVTKIADKTTEVLIDSGNIIGEKKPGIYRFGDKVTYHITVRNTGNTEISDIRIQDFMSKELKKMIQSGSFFTNNIKKTDLGNGIKISTESETLVILDKLIPGDSITIPFEVILKSNHISVFENIQNLVTVTGSYDPKNPKKVPKDTDDSDEDQFHLSYGYVEVTKVSDKVSGKEKLLEGAVFGVYREDGTFVDSIKTNEKGVARSRELGLGTYYLQETSAPEGFLLKKERIPFEIKKNLQVVKKKVKNSPEKKKEPEKDEEESKEDKKITTVKTGDNIDISGFVAFMMLACLIFIKVKTMRRDIS